MSKLQVHTMQGAPAGEFDLSDDLLVMNKGRQAVHDVVVAMQAAQRRGTASTLTKGGVAGSNKKPWKQKGTGRARAGYRQSPVWRGGGVAFGPKPRCYDVKVNRKVNRLAFQRAFSEKVSSGAVRVVDTLSVAEAKTRQFAALLKLCKIDGPAIFVVDQIDPLVARASRNIPRIEMVKASDLSVYQLLRYPSIVISLEGMRIVAERLAKRRGGAA